jgi:hypothetical protein
MAAYTRKQYSGAARNTTTTTLLTNVGTTVNIAATTGWPSIAGIPFYVVLNPSSIYEEKCLATISGSTLTLVRAQDDTTASEHPIGSVIYPVFTANDADEANELVSKLTTKGDILTTDGNNLLRLGVGTNGYFLKASSSASAGIEWASIPTINNLDDVGDVTISNIEGGDFLVYDSSASVWVNETIHFITVSDNPPDDEVAEGDLWYNSIELELYTYYSGAWVQMTDSQDGIQELYELVDVLIEDPVYGETLVYNGTEWENGPAGSALTLENARVISLSGDVSGSVLFDGSASVNISTIIQPNSVALGTDTTGNYMSDLTQGTGVSITHTPGEGSNAIVAIGQAVGTSASVTFAAVTAPVVGNASTASTLETARTISLTGDVSGSVSFNGSADASITATIQPNSVALGTDTTGNYMSDLTQGTGVTITHMPGEGSNATIAIGQAVATSSSVSFARLETSGDVVVGGDLTVNGTTTTLNTETLLVEDNIVVLNSGVTASPTLDSGIEVERGTSANVLIRWNETNDQWEFTNDGTTYGDIAALGTIELGTDTIGNFVSDITQGTGVTVTHTPGEGSSPTIAIGQAVETSSSVQFATVTAPLIGNASTASALATARTISLSGDLSGSASFNGASDITISASVVNSGVSLDEISDVVITSPEEFQSLVYDGTNFVNQYASVVTYVRNAEATTLTTGTVVYLFGATGDHASVKRADNDSDATSSKTVGIVAASIASAENGPVVTRGYVDGIDLSVGYSAGDILWLGDDGAFTKTKPTAPEHLVFVGVVVRATSNGIVYVATQNGYELDELHDVKINGVTDGQFLRYNSASTVWVNDEINLGTDTVGNYMSDLTQGTGVTITHTPSEGSNATIAIGQAVSTSSSVTFANVTSTGNVAISGRIDKTTVRESVADVSVSASAVTADYSTGDIFYVGTAPASNFTVNLTNAPTDDGKAITVVIFVTQGATGYYPNVVQVAGSAQTIKWANGAAPTPTSSAGKIDIFSFTFVRRSSAWTVFGSSNLGY